MDNVTIAKKALSLLDLTNLNDYCTEADVVTLVSKAVKGGVAAVCVWPEYVRLAREKVGNSGVRVATVVNFPYGNLGVDEIGRMVSSCVADGADEIDCVYPYDDFAQGNFGHCNNVVAEVLRNCGDVKLKMILETGYFENNDMVSFIPTLSRQVLDAGFDFVKTSTGKYTKGATPAMAHLLSDQVFGRAKPNADYNCGKGIKISGGVKTLDDVKRYFMAVCDDVETAVKALNPTNFRFGASGLYDNLVAVINDESETVSSSY